MIKRARGKINGLICLFANLDINTSVIIELKYKKRIIRITKSLIRGTN